MQVRVFLYTQILNQGLDVRYMFTNVKKCGRLQAFFYVLYLCNFNPTGIIRLLFTTSFPGSKKQLILVCSIIDSPVDKPSSNVTVGLYYNYNLSKIHPHIHLFLNSPKSCCVRAAELSNALYIFFFWGLFVRRASLVIWEMFEMREGCRHRL